MRIGIIGDPAEELKAAMDTTLLVAGECNRRGHEVFYTTPRSLVLTHNGPKATWRRFDYALNDGRRPEDCLGETLPADTSAFDVVFMRQDPPVSEHYISVTHILDFSKTPVINNPTDVRSFSEKISVLNIPDYSPKSIVSIDPGEIRDFVSGFPHGCVLKPLNQFNGRGVVRLRPSDANIGGLIESGTEFFTKYVIIQEFVPAVENGDKRFFLVEGKPIGRMNRVPLPGEWRSNIHLGAQPRRFEPSARDEAIIEAVAGLLARYDLPVACIDVIGDYLTEINVTSPSGIPEINRVYGPGHERPVVDCLERRARR
jgi:glutathione synthase